VDGMHWLQSSYATRFNRFRQERGHLFQGRSPNDSQLPR
jgi:putative transposase